MRNSELPQLALKLSASDTLALTLPFIIHLTIEQRDSVDTIIFDWSPYVHGCADSDFVLLHHTATDFEVVVADRSGLIDIDRHESLLVTGWNHSRREVGPGDAVAFQDQLPGFYQKLLEVDETYALLWGQADKCQHGEMAPYVRMLDVC